MRDLETTIRNYAGAWCPEFGTQTPWAEVVKAIAAHDRDVAAAERERCIRAATVVGMRVIDNHPVFDPAVSEVIAAIRAVFVDPQQKEGDHE